MKYERKTVLLKNGKPCTIMSPSSDEAEVLLHHLRLTSAETRNMLRYADEVKLTIDDEKKYLKNVIDDPAECLICAYIDGEHAGSASIAPFMRFDKCRHRAEFGMSIKEKFWHLGVGAALVTACIEAARQTGYEQIELEVVSDNARAIALYERLGFVTYGKCRNGFKFRDGSYIDELLMVLTL